MYGVPMLGIVLWRELTRRALQSAREHVSNDTPGVIIVRPPCDAPHQDGITDLNLNYPSLSRLAADGL